jgi:hypothetical protein
VFHCSIAPFSVSACVVPRVPECERQIMNFEGVCAGGFGALFTLGWGNRKR